MTLWFHYAKYVQAMKNKNHLATVLLPLFVFVCFYIYSSFEIRKKDLFIANTVGNNLLEVNRLYSKLNSSGGDYKNEQINFNKDMIIIIDCSIFIKNLKTSNANEELPYFIRGVRESLQVLSLNGMSRDDLAICDGLVLKFSDKAY